MKLIRLSVERPVSTAMVYLTVVLLGLIALTLLPRELFPTVTFPELLIVTRYGAAAPEEIENIITKVIEEQAGTIPNLKRVHSISREGLSVVVLEFNWGTDMGLAHLSVREKVDLIKDRLPSEAEEPVIQRYNPFAQPMMILSIAGKLSLDDLTRVSNDVIKKRLQKIDGVASATVSGGQQREILAEVDLEKMQSSNVSITGIVDALKTSNVNYPAGSTQGRFYEYLVRTVGEFKSIDEIASTIVAVDSARDSSEYLYRQQAPQKGGDTFQPRMQRLLPLGTIAEIKDTFVEAESYSRHNGNSNVSLSLQKQFNANTIKTVKSVRHALLELTSSLPKGMEVKVVYDESKFIQNSLSDVINSGLVGGFLAFLVLLYFLRKIQDALIITLAIPISFFVFFTFIYFSGRTINVIALAGLSLAIGSITDNAICVLDNIDKYRKRMDAKEAAIQGASEVALAQIASMLTNVAVFLPLLFAKGLAQQLFKDLFYAAVITNVAALFIALTLVPRIAAYPFSFSFKKKNADAQETVPAVNPDEDVLIDIKGKTKSLVPRKTAEQKQVELNAVESASSKKWAWLLDGLTDEKYQKLVVFYQRLLYWAIYNRRKVVSYTGILFLCGLLIFAFKSKIFMPSVDQGQFLVRLNMPVGTRLGVTDRVAKKIEETLGSMAEVQDVLVRVGSSQEDSIDALGSHQAECIVTIDRKKSKKATEFSIIALKEKINKQNMEGGEIEYLLQDSSMKAMSAGAPISIMVQGPDLGKLRKISEDIEKIVKKVEGVEGVKNSLALPSFETRVSIDKDRSSAFNLSVADIAHASLIGFRGLVATQYKDQGKEIPVRVRLKEEYRNNPAAIRRLSLRTQQGFMVPLGDVANIEGGYGPSEIQRIDQQRAITVTAQVFGRGVGSAIIDIEKELATYRVPKDYLLTFGGAKKEMAESFNGLIFAFILAVILIYMIMAAGFESLLHPFLIMGTVPMGVIGVAFTLLITFTPLSVPVFLGIVLLGGIVVNNGIVMIEHINELRKEHAESDLYDVTVLGCTNRLRPILMTALVNILALVPVAMAIGEGTEMSAPMALATLGGLFISTVLTLIVLPVFYVILEEYQIRRAASSS